MNLLECYAWWVICPFIFTTELFNMFFYTLTTRKSTYFLSSITCVATYALVNYSEEERKYSGWNWKGFLEVAVFPVVSSSETASSEQQAASLPEPSELLQNVFFLFLVLTHDMQLRWWPVTTVGHPIQTTNLFLWWDHPMTQSMCQYLQYLTSANSAENWCFVSIGIFFKGALDHLLYENRMVFTCITFH